MSKDDESEGWDPEDDQLEDKFKKVMTRYMEKLMEKMDEEFQRPRRPVHPAPLERYAVGSFAPTIYQPFVNLRKISNGWIVQYPGSSGLVETFATIDGIAQAAHDACVAAEEQYEQSKRLVDGLNRGGIGV